MRTRIKFCGMVRESDVATAAALGADAIGLVFHPGSSRFVTIDDARDLRRKVPSWVAVVGLFVDPADQLLAETVARVGLDVVQFHGSEGPAECARALAAGVPYWRAVRVREQADLLESFARFPEAEAFIADSWSSDYGGSGKRFDWSVIPGQRPPRLILAGGLTVENVGRSIDQVGPTGVDVSSGIQGADPREKDSRKMARFVQEVILADARREALEGEGDQ
jgi:phosphoribosylanthranilate isomerase